MTICRPMQGDESLYQLCTDFSQKPGIELFIIVIIIKLCMHPTKMVGGLCIFYRYASKVYGFITYTYIAQLVRVVDEILNSSQIFDENPRPNHDSNGSTTSSSSALEATRNCLP